MRQNKLYKKTIQEMEAHIQEANNTRSLATIQELMMSIKNIEEEIAKIQQQITGLLSKRSEPIDDEELAKLKAAVQAKVTQYKLLLNDKIARFEEMYSTALLMINRDSQIIKNQEEIVQLKHEIDINILEIEQKTAIIHELQYTLEQRKATYKALKQEIKELEQQCEELAHILK